MNHPSTQTHPKDKRPTLSVEEYLLLQGEKQRLEQMNVEIVRMQYRQDRQSAWIALLLLSVIVLAVGLLFAIMV